MDQQKPHGRRSLLTKRLERWTVELNAFLMVFAVGLAVLDLTCYATLDRGSRTAIFRVTAAIASGQAASAIYRDPRN
jgi:hypothetical protein